ncbi:MAG: hypothetical protein R3F43_19040 [bacterium]
MAVGLTLPLATWNPLGIQIELRADGPHFGLILPGPTPVELYPRFGGIAALVAGGQALLPAVLDQLVAAIPASAVRTAALDVATALGVYDAAGGFAAHVPAFQALLDGGFDVQLPATRAALAGALRTLLGLVPGAPCAHRRRHHPGWSTRRWPARSLTVGLDWAAALPALTLAASRTVAPVSLAAALGLPGCPPSVRSAGVNPSISFGFSGGVPTLVLQPLATGSGAAPARSRCAGSRCLGAERSDEAHRPRRAAPRGRAHRPHRAAAEALGHRADGLHVPAGQRPLRPGLLGPGHAAAVHPGPARRPARHPLGHHPHRRDGPQGGLRGGSRGRSRSPWAMWPCG